MIAQSLGVGVKRHTNVYSLRSRNEMQRIYFLFDISMRPSSAYLIFLLLMVFSDNIPPADLLAV